MAISTQYDSIFEKFRGNIPLAFLRVLAFTQSGMNPVKSVQGSAGLFMISDAALKAYDKKYPAAVTRKLTDLADPVLNTMIAVWIINNIVSYFKTHYPKTMDVNWNSPVYVAVVAHGFNVGYSEPKGIGAAIKVLEKNPEKFSLESLAQVSKELKLDERKYNEKSISRAKTVANLYVADLDGKAPITAPPGMETTVPKKGMGILMAIPIVGLFVYMFTRKK